MNKTILVTGGAGFIGSNLIETLNTMNCKVICIDNFDLFYPENIKYDNLRNVANSNKFKLVRGDIRDRAILNETFVNNKIDLVIHLAAKAGVRPSILNQKEYYDVNVNGTITLLEVMKEHNVNKLIFSSSSSVYGNNIKTPYSENDNVDYPISPYASTKKSGELITYTFHHLYKFDVLNLRFFTVFGKRQRPDLAIHQFYKKLYTNSPISIYGNGNTSRDYTYIADIIQGIISAIIFLDTNQGVYEIVNLGNSNPIRLTNLIDNIEIISGKKFLIEYLPMQPGDVELTCADINKAKQLLNYEPKTNLITGLKHFQDWFLKTTANGI